MGEEGNLSPLLSGRVLWKGTLSIWHFLVLLPGLSPEPPMSPLEWRTPGDSATTRCWTVVPCSGSQLACSVLLEHRLLSGPEDVPVTIPLWGELLLEECGSGYRPASGCRPPLPCCPSELGRSSPVEEAQRLRGPGMPLGAPVYSRLSPETGSASDPGLSDPGNEPPNLSCWHLMSLSPDLEELWA